NTAIGIGKGNIIIGLSGEQRGARSEEDELAPPADPLAPRSSQLAAPSKRRAAGTQLGDIVLSSHFACTDCGISFDEPSPQLFSFNSPQGMCLTCDGLGEFFSFDPERLVPDANKSFEQGCIELVGSWKGF